MEICTHPKYKIASTTSSASSSLPSIVPLCFFDYSGSFRVALSRWRWRLFHVARRRQRRNTFAADEMIEDISIAIVTIVISPSLPCLPLDTSTIQASPSHATPSNNSSRISELKIFKEFIILMFLIFAFDI